MKTVPLTANEIDNIKELYSQELDRLHKRAAEISSMLKKLQRKSDGIAEEEIADKTEKPGKKAGKPGRKKLQKEKTTSAISDNKSKVVEKKAKRGRPAKNPLVKANAKAEAKTGLKGKNKRTAEKATKAQKASKAVKTAKAKKGRPVKAKKGRPAKIQKVKVAKPQKAVKAKTVVKAAKVPKAVKAVKAVKTKGRPAKIAAPAVIEKKGKPGRKKSDNSKKSRWTTTIIELLETQNKLLSSRAIVDEVMKRQNIPAADYSKTRSIVAGSLSDLVLETKRLKTVPIPGQKGKLYGLSQWFDEKGNVTDKSKLS